MGQRTSQTFMALVRRVRVLSQELAAVSALLHREPGFTTQSLRRTLIEVERFGARLTNLGIESLDRVQLEDVADFVFESFEQDGEWRSPANAAQHFRRSAVRLTYHLARQLALSSGDPSIDLKLPPRSLLHARPLTDDEVGVCRAFASSTGPDSRLATAWALAESTATTSEIAQAKVTDLRLDEGRVWLHGSSKRDARWGLLSDWGIHHLHERVAALSLCGTTVASYKG